MGAPGNGDEKSWKADRCQVIGIQGFLNGESWGCRLFIGIHNAWDVVTYCVFGGEGQ